MMECLTALADLPTSTSIIPYTGTYSTYICHIRYDMYYMPSWPLAVQQLVDRQLEVVGRKANLKRTKYYMYDFAWDT